MIRKPWPIIILTFVLIFIPISNILTTFIINSHKTSFSNFIYSLFSLPSNHMKLANLIFPSFIAAFAVWSVKKWSYILLSACLIWISFNGIYNFYTYYGNLNFLQILFAIVSPIFFSLLVTLYFLIPTVKTTYFDPKIRWWEAKQRYEVNFVGVIENTEVKIKNISEGGIYFEVDKKLQLEEQYEISFKFNDEDFQIPTKVIFKRNDLDGYGGQFLIENDENTSNRLKRGMLHLHYSGAKPCRPIPLWNEDLKAWLLDVLKGKKGLTPEIPSKYQTK